VTEANKKLGQSLADNDKNLLNLIRATGKHGEELDAVKAGIKEHKTKLEAHIDAQEQALRALKEKAKQMKVSKRKINACLKYKKHKI
jgi:hypothetical protein